jgi:hypothetical protein
LRERSSAEATGERQLPRRQRDSLRRDWIHWFFSATPTAPRALRIAAACDMLAKGTRRPCCFDRSGMYAKSLSCPVAEDTGKRT